MLSSEFVGRGVSVESLLVASAPVAMVSRVQIQQVLINLLNNAQDAMADLPSSDRLIVVRVEEGDDGVTVIVDDTGPGIEMDRLEKVFESLYTTRPEGLGMGLAICQSIVNAHGGKIWAENRETGGARVTFSLLHSHKAAAERPRP
jgi:C4-dicarboxylate-specific signal transduction histidine kinase